MVLNIPNFNTPMYIEAAVSNDDGEDTFIEFPDNPYGNHLSGRKSGIYGDTNHSMVRKISSSRIFQKNSILKIDAEGADFEIVSSLLNFASENMSSIIYLCDWRDETRLNFYNFTQDRNSFMYKAFNEEIITSLEQLPKNQTADFVFLKF